MDLNDPKWVDLDVKGERSGKQFRGNFKLKPYLAHKESADASRLAEMYRRGIQDDWDQRTFLTLLAYLKFHVIETDAVWWKAESGLDLIDRDPVITLGEKLSEVQGVKNEKDAEPPKAP